MKLLIAQPPKYKITYKKKSGIINEYILTIVGVHTDYFTGYCFGHGLRSFKNDRVLNIEIAGGGLKSGEVS